MPMSIITIHSIFWKRIHTPQGEGLDLIGKTAKQVQPKVVHGNKSYGEQFVKVDEEKVRACSTYYWRRSEIKEKASIYYR